VGGGLPGTSRREEEEEAALEEALHLALGNVYVDAPAKVAGVEEEGEAAEELQVGVREARAYPAEEEVGVEQPR
jgi:hypothetical protein